MDFEELDLNRTYTYADYLKWNFEVDGIPQRIELIDGRVFKMWPAPSRKHQDIFLVLLRKIERFTQKFNHKYYSSPFELCLAKKTTDITKINTVVRPDLCIISDLDIIDKSVYIGVPDIVIEILSPGDCRKEMKEKFEAFEKNGVKEYWLIYPYNEFVMVFTLNKKGEFVGSKPFVKKETIKSKVLEGLEIEVGDIFKN
jgi:Uma2 family endonuclease